MKNNNWILEALHMQPLSEEEKSKRHILGRLYGPIATCEEATRNGRKYNRDLWEKALNDEVFKEKIANKSLFLELGHPADREETDMEKVCACIPEIPKIVDGDLYAVVDILDTTNGKLLKTLCDYGFTPGISSRGSGDVMANNEVDPDTFFLETWDIVQLPAVKKARLSMCESLDTQQAGLKRALLESYKAADNKEKIEMKEALDNLSIDLNTADEDIPDADPSLYDDDDSAEPLVEKASKEETDKTEENKSVDEAPVEIEETDTDDNADNDAVTGMLTADDAIAIAVKTVLDLLNDKAKGAESIPTDDEIASVAKTNVAEVLDKQATEIKAVSDDELPDADPSIEGDIDETSDEKPEEADKSSDKATDDGVKEWLESFKELTKQKDLLENENRQLKLDKTVSDAKVLEQKAAIDHYKVSLDHARKLAAKSKEFKEQASALSEQLESAKINLRKAESKAEKTDILAEKLKSEKTRTERLTEHINAAKNMIKDADAKAESQYTKYKQKFNEAISIAKSYKAKYEETVNHYIETKADLLGVRTSEITNRLQENYSLADVDTVCESLLEKPAQFSNTLFKGLNNGAKMKINESLDVTEKPKKSEADDIFDGLLELAGLKK